MFGGKETRRELIDRCLLTFLEVRAVPDSRLAPVIEMSGVTRVWIASTGMSPPSSHSSFTSSSPPPWNASLSCFYELCRVFFAPSSDAY